MKNSEVKDDFKAKGLKEAGAALDVMRLPPDDLYSYNRYLDSLHYKASEIYSLEMQAEERVRADAVLGEKINTAKNAIAAGLDDKVISQLTQLTIEQIQEIRADLDKT